MSLQADTTPPDETCFVPSDEVHFVRRDLLLVLLLALLVGLPTLWLPFENDHGIYAYVGDVITHGGLPYRDAWDVKPVGVYYLYALAFELFGRREWAPRVLDLALNAATALLLCSLAGGLRGRAAGLLAGGGYAVWYFAGSGLQLANSEGFAALPVVGAVALLVAARPPGGRSLGLIFLAGLALGWAFALKYTYLALILAFTPFVALPGGSRSALRLLLWLAGVACLPACIWLYFSARGAQGDLREAVAWIGPYSRAGGYSGSELIWSGVRAFSAYAGAAPLFCYGALAAAIMLVHQFVTPLWRASPELRIGAQARARGFPQVMLLVWFLASGLIVIAQRKYYVYHLGVLIAPAALLFGLWGAWALQSLRSPGAGGRSGLRPLALGLALGLATAANLGLHYKQYLRLPGCILRGSWDDWRGQFGAELSRRTEQEVAGYLQAHSNPADTVYVFGSQPGINFLAQRRAPSRFITSQAQICDWASPAWRQELVETLRATSPKYFLLVHKDHIPWMSKPYDAYLQEWPELWQWFRSHYALEKSISNVDLYRWKS